MGASSSGLLDEVKINHVKELVNSIFHSFSELYHQQYSSAYLGHIHQEVEPKKEGRGLLLTHRPQYGPEEVLYQGSVKFSCWDEQGKKCRDRYAVLRRDYTVEIHENMETFSRGCAAKLVLQPAGGVVLTEEEESRVHLEKKCSGILNGVKEDSSSVVSSSDEFAVYLHLPYTGHTCFLFQQAEERDHFLSALKTCIRHCNLDPWWEFSYENQAYIRALKIYQQDKGSYNTWEILLGTEEQVLAYQVMQEVLPWLQSQLQSRVKGKKPERIRQWLTTLQATYMLVLDLMTANLEALREKCRQTASANQALIRSNLDQIMSSHCFLEQKVRACICEEAEKVYSEAIAPYMSSILEVLTENISAGIQGMRQTLHTQMDSAFKATSGGSEETKKALLTLRSISLDHCYTQVTNLTEILVNLKERFGLNSVDRLVHSAHLEMEQLLDSAVYTLELFLQSSAKLEPSQIPVKMERAKERVLKQLDYDSRLVQRRLYQEALLEITLPGLTRRMESKRQNELQQFEQYIFSDYSSFILVHNVFDDVLRDILSKEIETVVQDAASQKSNNLLLDISDLAISQYSLLGQTPPHPVPDSPAIQARDSSSAGPSQETAPVPEEGGPTVSAQCQSDPELKADAKSHPSTTPTTPVLLSPLIIITQEFDESARKEEFDVEEICDTTPTAQSATAEPPSLATSYSNTAATNEAETADPPTVPESMSPSPDSPVPAASALSSSPSTDVTAVVTEAVPGDQSAMLENSGTSVQIPEDVHSNPPSCSSPSHPLTDSPVIISLTLLNEAAASVPQSMTQQSTDRAVYLTGSLKDNWEVEKAKVEQQREANAGEKIESRGEDEEKGNRLERRHEDEEEAEDNGDDAEKGEEEDKEEEVEEEPLQNPEPQESQPDSSELPFDSVTIIRHLVTEIIEVETVVSSNSSNTL